MSVIFHANNKKVVITRLLKPSGTKRPHAMTSTKRNIPALPFYTKYPISEPFRAEM